ncbi:unnamed protein product [Sphagnum tenellum]
MGAPKLRLEKPNYRASMWTRGSKRWEEDGEFSLAMALAQCTITHFLSICSVIRISTVGGFVVCKQGQSLLLPDKINDACFVDAKNHKDVF